MAGPRWVASLAWSSIDEFETGPAGHRPGGGSLLATGVASAQPVTGVYIGAGAGVNWLGNPEHVDVRNGLGGARDDAGKLGSKVGWGGVLSLG